MADQSKPLTTAQTARELHVSVRTLQRLVRRGKITQLRSSNGGSLYDPAVVNAFAVNLRRQT